MSERPFMKLWVSDFLGDTLDLDAAEVGSYLLLLMAQWNRGGRSLPDDHEKLKRICRCRRNWPRVWGNIERFFERDEDGIYSRRLRSEAEAAAAKQEVNAQSGARGGRAKALKYSSPGSADAEASPAQLPAAPDTSPDENEKPAAAPRKGTHLPEGWVLPREWGEWAVAEGWSERVIREEAEKFRDHWISVSGQRGRKRDWRATWRNWMRNSKAPRVFEGGHQDGRGKERGAKRERQSQIIAVAARGTTEQEWG